MPDLSEAGFAGQCKHLLRGYLAIADMRSNKSLQQARLSESAAFSFEVSSYQVTAAWSRVSELDHLKEQVAYLKFWQGIVVLPISAWPH